jgi:hypothetical protein
MKKAPPKGKKFLDLQKKAIMCWPSVGKLGLKIVFDKLNVDRGLSLAQVSHYTQETYTF